MLTYERQVIVGFVLSADKLYIETVLKYCVSVTEILIMS